MTTAKEKQLARLEAKREQYWAEFEDRRAAISVDLEAYAEGRYPVTDRQRSFVRNFIQHWNAERAYVEAGYKGDPGDGARRLLRVPAVAAAIGYEQKIATEKAGFTSEWVMEEIKRLYPKYTGEDPVPVVASFQGEIISEEVRKFHGPETKALLEMVAKSTDFFDGGSSPDKQVTVQIDMGKLGTMPSVRNVIDEQ